MEERIGKYELLGKLGAGGMAVVYQARDTVLERIVALKVINTQRATDEQSYKRFLREARVSAALSHPNIVVIHELGLEDGQPFIAMEYLPGQDLGEVIAEDPPPDLTRKVDIALQIAGALEYAHSQGVIHRDIKPANIRILPNGTCKLVDFGIAKMTAEQPTALTQTGAIVGSLSYLSPEQAHGKELTGASDVFSFGVVLYEMVTGRRPFEGMNLAAILYAILSTEVPEIEEDAGPPELRELISKCLEKSVDARYQGFAPVVAGLQRILKRLERKRRGGPATDRAVGTKPRRPARTSPPTEGHEAIAEKTRTDQTIRPQKGPRSQRESGRNRPFLGLLAATIPAAIAVAVALGPARPWLSSMLRSQPRAAQTPTPVPDEPVISVVPAVARMPEPTRVPEPAVTEPVAEPLPTRPSTVSQPAVADHGTTSDLARVKPATESPTADLAKSVQTVDVQEASVPPAVEPIADASHPPAIEPIADVSHPPAVEPIADASLPPAVEPIADTSQPELPPANLAAPDSPPPTTEVAALVEAPANVAAPPPVNPEQASTSPEPIPEAPASNAAAPPSEPGAVAAPPSEPGAGAAPPSEPGAGVAPPSEMAPAPQATPITAAPTAVVPANPGSDAPANSIQGSVPATSPTRRARTPRPAPTLTPEPAAPAPPAQLRVLVEPAAPFRIDGGDDLEPNTWLTLPSGSHSLFVFKPGYQAKTLDFVLLPNENRELRVQLKPQEAKYGLARIKIVGVDWAWIRIDNGVSMQWPCDPLKLTAGQHDLRVWREDLERRANLQIRVPPDLEKEFVVDLSR